MSILAVSILIAGLLVFGWRRLLSYLRYFQQEEYTRARFARWLNEKRAYDRRGTCVMGLVTLGAFLTRNPAVELGLAVVAAAALIGIALFFEEDPRKSGKIKLVMTDRAAKIASVAMMLFCAASATPFAFSCFTGCSFRSPFDSAALLAVLIVQTPPLLLMAANALLWPAEKAVQQRFYSDAQRILREVDPFIVGITGSYGKTGAKAALGELLSQCLGPTFWPKKSINTIMGITRTIRETMKPHHKFAVMEMGAYNIGSIKRLCDFTPPKAALVTAVGIMHLERFGSPENVYKAKSEIAQALPADGILVCNGDSPNARRMAKEFVRQTTLLYGLDPSAGPLDCLATDISFDDRGTTFVIHWKGQQYPARTPLLGRPALLNILGAFTMACALGAEPAYAAACLANLEPVENRLVLDRSSEVGYLRDAYNSNPTGFAAALEVLQGLSANKKILMTPGMIELGDQQFEQNRSVARIAAGVADLVIVVGKTNRDALVSGLHDANFPKERMIVVDTREEAFSVVRSRAAAGDLVLIENDLGDLYEGRVRF